MSLIVGGKNVRRRMRRNHFYFVIILILFASIGVGYAALTSTISINGTTQIKSAKWDVHFANVTKGGNSVGAASATLSDNNTTLTVSGITLSSPGSEYEVYVNVVNGGTIDANLSSLVKSGLSPAQQQYLSYNVTYAFNRPIKQNDLLKAGSFETLRISIKYNDNKSNAPSTSQSIGTMTFKLNYVQDKGTGVARAKLCKRATTLHSGTVGSTTVNFGQIGTTGTLASGDAFDCDVNGDGVYDSATERFYYVTDLTTYQNTAVLVYYGNSSSTGVSLNNRSPYYANGNIYSGPITAVNLLPTRSAWPRVGLIVRTAQIYNYEGGTTVTEQTSSTTSVTHNLPKYTYTTAARLLTYQEFRKITDNSFFWENFGGSAASCIWLNTTYTNATSKHIFAIQNPTGTSLSAMPKDGTSTTSLCGVRPVIEVLKSDMIY